MKDRIMSMSTWKKVLLGVFMVIVLAVACTPTDTSEEVAREEQVESVEVAGGVETAETTEPVEVEVVEETSKKKEFSLDELQYLEYTMSHSSDLSSQFFKLSDLMSNPIDADEWVMDVVISIARIQELADEYIEYKDIPELFKGVDREYKQAMVLYSDAMENMPSALDRVFDYNDDSELAVEMSRMQDGVEHVEAATIMIEEISVEHNQ